MIFVSEITPFIEIMYRTVYFCIGIMYSTIHFCIGIIYRNVHFCIESCTGLYTSASNLKKILKPCKNKNIYFATPVSKRFTDCIYTEKTMSSQLKPLQKTKILLKILKQKI